MRLALYEPNLGYYSVNTENWVNKAILLPHLKFHPFTECIGIQCCSVLEQLAGGDILEIGAGTGKMAGDLLLFLEQRGVLPTHYFILEISPDLIQRQKKYLAERIPHLFSRLQWLDSPLKKPLKGLILANEVADALPVHRFVWRNQDVAELRVRESGAALTWQFTPVRTRARKEKLLRLRQNYFPNTSEYVSEVCFGLAAWVRQLSEMLKQGVILVIDYGYGAREYYHPQRKQGTLRCYWQHSAHDNPFVAIGQQDITASVDFSRLARCASQSGLQLASFTTQAAFLLNNGLLERLEKWYNPDLILELKAQVQCLTSPNEMGERIKVMSLTRDFSLDEPNLMPSNCLHTL
ncbi:class I SAM-dependent methyltransferase [Rickettsiella massiliensis]|uniref:class I SAM-dependent methyltransferase n=1 Tax=Rickettsiella massiliensis TaxID=676517 RepID=UPI00029A7357|nr:SAM-dependent methyltransferase [Rickettsiella massiliensis]